MLLNHLRSVIDLTLGINKRSKRVTSKRFWYEGSKLVSCGFKIGSKYTFSENNDEQSFIIALSDSGTRVVSKKTKKGIDLPVIDICNQGLTKLLGEKTSRIRVELYSGYIKVSIHPQEKANQERITRFLSKIRLNQPLHIGDVCHGAGILYDAVAEGLNKSGLKTKLSFAIEIDEPTMECSLLNNPHWEKDSIAFNVGLQDVPLDKIPKTEILISGLPCSGASRAGKSKNNIKNAEEHSLVGSLFTYYLNIVQQSAPFAIIFEEVQEYSNSVSMTVIRNVLEHLGYELTETIVDNSLGSFEQRKRLCMVAVTKGMKIDLDLLLPSRERESNLGLMLEYVSLDDNSWKAHKYLYDKEVKDIAAGKGFRMQLKSPSDTSIGCIGAGYAKCRSSEPFIKHPTLKRHQRLLTVNEHARVKSIPLHLVHNVSDTLGHKILGNSVLHACFVSVGILMARYFDLTPYQYDA